MDLKMPSVRLMAILYLGKVKVRYNWTTEKKVLFMYVLYCIL